MLRKFLHLTVVICFFLTTTCPLSRARADSLLDLPAPGTIINLSPGYVPLMITGLTLHPDNPLLIDFIVSTGNSGVKASQVSRESNRLIKYFLACLTIPEDNQWVNLSPYEKDRIVPDDLGQTVLGQDMLAQDYLLKQMTASLIYPERDLGRNFWDRVYAKANQMFGTTQIPVNTFNKVWILPDTAKVYEHKDTVFVVKSHLRVMLEEDYLALQKHGVIASEAKQSFNKIATSPSAPRNDTRTLSSQIIRQVILPALEKEVNQGRNFANLRQIYNSMILAVWFKQNLKQAFLNQVYTGKSKVNGVNVDDPAIKEKIYRQYLQAYKKGVFNYIKEESSPPLDGEPASASLRRDGGKGGVIARKYFSGGVERVTRVEMASQDEAMTTLSGMPGDNINYDVKVRADKASGNPNAAMTARLNELLGRSFTLVNHMEEANASGHFYDLDNALEKARVPLAGSSAKNSPYLFAFRYYEKTETQDVTQLSIAEIKERVAPFLPFALSDQDAQRLKDRKPFSLEDASKNYTLEGRLANEARSDQVALIEEAALKSGLLGTRYFVTNIKRFSPNSPLLYMRYFRDLAKEFNGHAVFILSIEESDKVLLGDLAGMGTAMAAVRSVLGDEFLDTANIDIITDGGLKTRAGGSTALNGYNGLFPTAHGIPYYRQAMQLLGKVRMQHVGFGQGKVYWTASDGDYQVGNMGYGHNLEAGLENDGSWSLAIHGVAEEIVAENEKHQLFTEIDEAGDLSDIQDRLEAFPTIAKALRVIRDNKLTELGENFSHPKTGRLATFIEKPSAVKILQLLREGNINSIIPNAFLIVYDQRAFRAQQDEIEKVSPTTGQALREFGGSYFDFVVGNQFEPSIAFKKLTPDQQNQLRALHQVLPASTMIAANQGEIGSFTDRGKIEFLVNAYDEEIQARKIRGESGLIKRGTVRIGKNVILKVAPGATVILDNVIIESEGDRPIEVDLSDSAFLQNTILKLSHDVHFGERAVILNSRIQGKIDLQADNHDIVVEGVVFAPGQVADFTRDGQWENVQSLELYSGEMVVSILKLDGKRYINRGMTKANYKGEPLLAVFNAKGLYSVLQAHPRLGLGLSSVKSSQAEWINHPNWQGKDGQNVDITTAKAFIDYVEMSQAIKGIAAEIQGTRDAAMVSAGAVASQPRSGRASEELEGIMLGQVKTADKSREFKSLMLQYYQAKLRGEKADLARRIKQIIDAARNSPKADGQKQEREFTFVRESDIAALRKFPDEKPAEKYISKGLVVPQFLFAGVDEDNKPLYDSNPFAGQPGKSKKGQGPRQIIAWRLALQELAERLSKEFKISVEEILGQQKIIVNINEDHPETVLGDFIRNGFYGLNSQNVYFMAQRTYYKYKYLWDGVTPDETSKKTLYGHGDNFMQLGQKAQAFTINKEGVRTYLEESIVDTLPAEAVIITHRLDDATQWAKGRVINLQSLSFAIEQIRKGQDIVVELVSNPDGQAGGTVLVDKDGHKFLMESKYAQGNDGLMAILKEAHEAQAPLNAFRNTYGVGALKRILKSGGLPYYLRFADGLYLDSSTSDVTRRRDVKTAFVSSGLLKPLANYNGPRDNVGIARSYLLESEYVIRQAVDRGLASPDAAMAVQQMDTLTGAEAEIGKILGGQFQSGGITEGLYKNALQNTYKNLYEWTTDDDIYRIDPSIRQTNLQAISQGRWEDIIEAYRQEVAFGTAGIRGKAVLTFDELQKFVKEGPLGHFLKGPNTINVFKLLKTTAGVIRFAKETGRKRIVIGYDSRIGGEQLAQMIARLFIAQSTADHQFKIFLFDEASPFPELSFGITTDAVKGDIGLLISASHNPADYNGYKITLGNGSQLNQKSKDAVVAAIGEVKNSEIVLADSITDAKPGQIVWLGADEPLAGKDYHGFDRIDMHSLYVQQSKRFFLNQPVVDEYGKQVRIGYAAFNGAGFKAVPRLLRETGFTNFQVIDKLQRLDGTFPAWKFGEQPDPGDPISADIAVREFIAEHGQQDFDDLDMLIGTDPDADRMGLVVKVPAAQQKLFGKYRLLSANDTWTLLLWYRLTMKKQMGLLKNPADHTVLFSHATTDAIEAVAREFGIEPAGKMLDMTGTQDRGGYLSGRRTWVGFTYLAEVLEEMEQAGKYVEILAEESNGVSIQGHTKEKDGTLAGILLAEVAAYAKSQHTTMFELLEKVYAEIGHYATANKPLPRVGSFEKAAGISEKINIIRKSQEWERLANERAGTSNPFIIAGKRVIGAVQFASGRIDKSHYEGVPDEGVRFFFEDETMKPGDHFTNSRNYIMIRASGTSQALRFYIQIFSKEATPDKMALNYHEAERIALEAQKQILEDVGLAKHLPLVTRQLESLSTPDVDRATLAKSPEGGIDLNSKNMRMDASGEKVDIHFDASMIAEFKRGNFSGIAPKVLGVSPIHDIMALLGIQK